MAPLVMSSKIWHSWRIGRKMIYTAFLSCQIWKKLASMRVRLVCASWGQYTFLCQFFVSLQFREMSAKGMPNFRTLSIQRFNPWLCRWRARPGCHSFWAFIPSLFGFCLCFHFGASSIASSSLSSPSSIAGLLLWLWGCPACACAFTPRCRLSFCPLCRCHADGLLHSGSWGLQCLVVGLFCLSRSRGVQSFWASSLNGLWTKVWIFWLLYRCGKTYGSFAETLNALTSWKPAGAWDFGYVWMQREMSSHHSAMPRPVALDVITIGMLWGWTPFSGPVALMWAGLFPWVSKTSKLTNLEYLLKVKNLRIFVANFIDVSKFCEEWKVHQECIKSACFLRAFVKSASKVYLLRLVKFTNVSCK